MRILHLNHFGSNRGGVESYIADVAAALQAHGHASHLIALAPNDSGEPIVTTTHAPTLDWPSSVDSAVSVINDVIARFQPDVAYLHAVYHPGLVSWVAQQLPSIAYMHGPYSVCPGSAQYLRKSSKVCPQTAGAICLINAQREKCCWGRNPRNHWRLLQRTRQFERAQCGLRRIMVGSRFMQQLLVRGGVPLDKISFLAPILLDPANLPKVEPSEPGTILFAGRLTPEKGLKHLIQALATADASWHLLVAGEGPELDACHILAKQLNIADKIEFLGWIDSIEMKTLYQRCAFVAVPSLWPEPFGRIGPEAFMYSRPVVAYSTGGIPDWLDDNETGFLVPPGDVGQFGQRLRQMLATPAVCQQMGALAQQRALARWGFTQHIEQLLHAFNSASTTEHNRRDQS
jgi:glycosyltransferase involved in cell wall biosynthesis